jgi:hypothetical protein
MAALAVYRLRFRRITPQIRVAGEIGELVQTS